MTDDKKDTPSVPPSDFTLEFQLNCETVWFQLYSDDIRSEGTVDSMLLETTNFWNALVNGNTDITSPVLCTPVFHPSNIAIAAKEAGEFELIEQLSHLDKQMFALPGPNLGSRRLNFTMKKIDFRKLLTHLIKHIEQA